MILGYSAGPGPELLAFIGKTTPAVLFLPTAAKDSQEYAASAEAEFRALGAGSFQALYLTRNPAVRTVDDAFAAADVVFFGGGSASLTVKHGDRYGFKERLRSALTRGVVLGGTSGGAIALFEGGAGAYNGYKPLPGWGLVPGGMLPHFHIGEEKGAAPWFAGDTGKVLYGVEDGAALVWDGATVSAIGGVWKLMWDGARVIPTTVSKP